MKKITVTGATGFIGQYLLQALAQEYELVALTTKSDTSSFFQHDALSYRQTDYSRQTLDAALSGCDALVHLAAKRPQANSELSVSNYFENMLLSETVFQACRDLGISNVVNISSISVYSRTERKTHEESEAAQPYNLYGVAKLASEAIAQIMNQENGMYIKSLRVASVFGLGERKEYMSAVFLRRCLENVQIVVYGDGTEYREYVYVKDVCRAISCALKAERQAGIFNIGSNKAISNREMAQLYCEIFESTAGFALDSSKPSANISTAFSIEKAKNLLGYIPAFSMKEALVDMKRNIQHI